MVCLEWGNGVYIMYQKTATPEMIQEVVVAISLQKEAICHEQTPPPKGDADLLAMLLNKPLLPAAALQPADCVQPGSPYAQQIECFRVLNRDCKCWRYTYVVHAWSTLQGSLLTICACQ